MASEWIAGRLPSPAPILCKERLVLAKRKSILKQVAELEASGRDLEQQLENLMEQRKYPQAIRKLQQSLKRDPRQKLGISEVDIYLRQGQEELEEGRYVQAETALAQAFAQAQNEETYYWLAKCFVAQQKLTEALELFQSAFDNKSLPKNLGGGYLKLLCLTDQVDQVEELIQKQAKRFYAYHLHWARGVLALEADEPAVALTHFQKMGRTASPGDDLGVWQAYGHQRLGQWTEAKQRLSMKPPTLGSPLSFGNPLFRPQRTQHPAVKQLTLAQVAQTGESALDYLDLQQLDPSQASAAGVLELLHLIRESNCHDAAHLYLGMPPYVKADYPELEGLYRPLMLLAGEQAQREQELDCTATFWGNVVQQPTFEPKLAIQLYPVLDEVGEHREAQQLVKQLVRHVRKEAKQNPAAWPEARRQSTLAKLHCWMADSQMAMGKRREAQRSLQEAEQLAPEHPDVLGRRGLNAALEKDSATAIALLTQALAAGCRHPEVYIGLLQELKADPEAQQKMRIKYGKHFGDLSAETEVLMPAWVEALTLQNYALMAQVVTEQAQPKPPTKALQIFLDAADDEPSSSQKITLNQAIAVPQWDQLLQSVSPEEQVDCLTAIYIAVQNHARRNKKGIAALQSGYDQQIFALIPEVPKAALAHLMLLPIKKLSDERLAIAVQAALARSTQPSDLLAAAQLHLRRFSDATGFRPFIDQLLQQEPHHPRLLLAKATLFPDRSPQYQTLYEQGFEIARRLQDAAALQAYREEDWVVAQKITGNMLGDQMGRGGDPSQIDMLDMLQRMAREAFGMDVPPEMIEQMLPELMGQMGGAGFDDGYDDEEDEDEDDGFFFLPPPPQRGKKKKRKSFFDL